MRAAGGRIAWALAAAAAFAPGCATGGRPEAAPWADAGDPGTKVVKKHRHRKEKTELDYYNDLLRKEIAASERKFRERDEPWDSIGDLLLRPVLQGLLP